jgi:transposase-like protein
MAQRDIESALEKALGQVVISQSAVSALTDRLRHAYAALRPRERSGFAIAYVVIATVYEPLRCWGSKTGILCGWGRCVDGRTVLLPLSTAPRESDDSCLEGLRALGKRGLQTPVALTTEGALGVSKAIEAMWPRSLRIRCWLHQRQPLHEKVPPQAWPAFKALVADRRDAPTCEEGQRRQQALLAHSQATVPEACRCLEEDAEARLNHLKVPARHRQ